MKKHHYFILLLVVLLAFSAGFMIAPKQLNTVSEIQNESTATYTVSDHAADKHHASSDVPCKSEFPEDWSKEKIESTLLAIAQDKTLDWNQEENGYFVVDKTVDGLAVRTVVDREKNLVVTGYPVNVERNACPAREGSGNAEPSPAEPSAQPSAP